MNITEAYNILEVDPNISNEDLKKHYKSLAIKFHPDLSKDPEKFKKINEAHQYVLDYRQNPHKYQTAPQQGGGFGFVDLGDILFNNIGDFFNHKPHKTKPINIDLNITFVESATGCAKPIKYMRNVKCPDCQGEGQKRIPNSCKDCNGFGQKTNNQNGFVYQSKCEKCKGKNIKQDECKKCSALGVIEEERNGNIQIPAGIQNDHISILQNEGHYIGQTFMFDTYTDVNIKINVENHPTMSIRGKNIFSTINIDLIEALQGKYSTVDTIYGNKEIKIPAKSRNADIIEIEGCGVGRNGKHLVMLDVKYPDDISNLVEVLNGNNGTVRSEEMYEANNPAFG